MGKTRKREKGMIVNIEKMSGRSKKIPVNMKITPTMIYDNEHTYGFLVWYFLDKLSDPYFERELEQAKNQRWFICENIASWIPYDKHAELLLQRIKEFAAAIPS